MRPTQVVDPSRLEQVLAESIAEQRQALITHQGEAGWRMFKATFRSGSRTSRTIVAEVQVPPELPEAALPRATMQLGVTFRVGHKKFLFATTLTSLERCDDRVVASLVWPECVQQLQRRVYERAKPPRNSAIAVRLWRDQSGTAPVEGGAGRTVRHGQLENLSAGGMQVKVADPADFEPGSVYRCIFTPRRGKPAIIVDALVRHREAGDRGRASIGFQFIGLEATAEGQHVLDRLARTVSEFHRAQARGRRRDEDSEPPSPSSESPAAS